MIQEQTLIKISDNSGVKKVKCIKVLGGTNKKFAKIGDIIKISVFNSNVNSKIKKSQVLKALIIRTKVGIKRNDGTRIKFNENSSVLLNNNENFIGTRVSGVVLKEIKNNKFEKLISVSNEIL